MTPPRPAGRRAPSPSVLLRDRALLWFTCSGLLASFVGGAFASCLAVCAGGRQQRFRRESGGRGAAGQRRGGGCSAVRGWPAAEREKYPPADDLRHRLLCDRPCGLYVLWRQPVGVGISAAIFTLGEVIYAPGEYMLIDHIAPPDEGQLLLRPVAGVAGAAFNPMLTGLILTHLPHWSLLSFLSWRLSPPG